MIDWTRTNALRSEVGEEDFDEILAFCLEELAEGLDLLSTPQSDSALKAQLHGLRGAATNIGMQSFSELCAASEAMPSRLDIPALRASFAASEQALQAGEPALR